MLTRYLDLINDLASNLLDNKYFRYVLSGIILFIIIRWLYYIDTYAVNLLTRDEWDLYNPYFYEYSLIKTFLFQHGPHRQGMGALIIELNNLFTSWNNKSLGYVNFLIILFSPLFYLILKRNLFKGISSFDSLIFLIALLPAQYALFTKIPNPSHGPLPALLISLLCLSFLIRNISVRNLVILIINFNMIFSGFGFAIAVITPLIFLGELFWFHTTRNYRGVTISLVSILIALFSVYLYFQDYRYDAPSSAFSFPHSRPWEYLFFISLSYSKLFGLGGINMFNIIIGLFILSLLLYIMVWQIITLSRHSFSTDDHGTSLNKIIVILIGFSLIFISGTSVGRIGYGLEMAQSSRYMPYLIPSIIGVYLYFVSQKSRYRPLYLLCLLVIVLITSSLVGSERSSMQKWAEQKTAWKRTYLETGSIPEANKVSGLKTYPKPQRTRLEEKLDYLKKHQLNLYSDTEDNAD